MFISKASQNKKEQQRWRRRKNAEMSETLECRLSSDLCNRLLLTSSPSSLPTGEDDDDEECGEEKLPSCFDYVMHFLTVFWKVLFAFVPPTEYWNGWACFFVSICMIGLLTAVIGMTQSKRIDVTTASSVGLEVVLILNDCRRPGLPVRLHCGPERLRHSGGVCCSGNLCTRWVCLPSRIYFQHLWIRNVLILFRQAQPFSSTIRNDPFFSTLFQVYLLKENKWQKYILWKIGG